MYSLRNAMSSTGRKLNGIDVEYSSSNPFIHWYIIFILDGWDHSLGTCVTGYINFIIILSWTVQVSFGSSIIHQTHTMSGGSDRPIRRLIGAGERREKGRMADGGSISSGSPAPQSPPRAPRASVGIHVRWQRLRWLMWYHCLRHHQLPTTILLPP